MLCRNVVNCNGNTATDTREGLRAELCCTDDCCRVASGKSVMCLLVFSSLPLMRYCWSFKRKVKLLLPPLSGCHCLPLCASFLFLSQLNPGWDSCLFLLKSDQLDLRYWRFAKSCLSSSFSTTDLWQVRFETIVLLFLVMWHNNNTPLWMVSSRFWTTSSSPTR